MNAKMIAELGELRKDSGYSNPANGAWQSRGNLSFNIMLKGSVGVESAGANF